MEMDLFGFYQEHFYVRDERLLSCLVENSKVRLVPKNEVFQRMGQVNPNLDIMVHGLVRGFFPDCTGKDITDCFEFSPGIPLMTSFELNEVSVISMEALRETVMVSMPLARLMPFLDHPAVMRFYVQFLSRARRRHWESKMILSQYSAKDRYRWFLGKYPGVIDMVNHHYVASFLGMTPVTLSRIRSAERQMDGVAPEERAPGMQLSCRCP